MKVVTCPETVLNLKNLEGTSPEMTTTMVMINPEAEEDEVVVEAETRKKKKTMSLQMATGVREKVTTHHRK